MFRIISQRHPPLIRHSVTWWTEVVAGILAGFVTKSKVIQKGIAILAHNGAPAQPGNFAEYSFMRRDFLNPEMESRWIAISHSTSRVAIPGYLATANTIFPESVLALCRVLSSWSL